MSFVSLCGMCVLFLVIPFLMLSCQKKDEKVVDEKKLKVVTSLFPLYDFAKNIGMQKADVTLLLSPGVEPHSFEPKPVDILKINEADFFVHTGRFMEPWVEDILKGIGGKGLLVIDSSRDIKFTEKDIESNPPPPPFSKGGMGGFSDGMDPHIWLDLPCAKKMVDNILGGFVKKDPVNKDFYLKNAEDYKARLDELDKKFKDSLANCKKDVFIHGGHFAFGYLVKRYNLKYLSAYKGFSPDAEPTPRNLIELSKKLKQ
ncbi:MAG: zinc ABC transporter substrate-binding protein, partial [Nitrospirota bacterium]